MDQNRPAPKGVVPGNPPDVVSLLVRATSPPYASFLAGEFPGTISAGLFGVIWLSGPLVKTRRAFFV